MNIDTIPTGSTLLDLVVGGEGYPAGQIVNIIGDSSAGKTFLSVEAVYQAKKKYGDKIRVRYNDCEAGFGFNCEELYGFDIREELAQTSTIQEFAADLGIFCDEISDEEFGIYIIDSFDGLASDADIEEFEERKKNYENGKDYSRGSYDMSKQKYSSKLFRTLTQTLKGKNVLLIIISQIRANVGVSFGANYSISGGKALQFYSSIRLFLKSVETFAKNDRSFGYCAKVTAIKSRSKHPNRSCHLNILFEYGVDDISSNVDFLFDLKDSQGKLDKVKSKSVSWKESDVELDSDSMKEFMNEIGIMEEFTENYNRFSMKRASEFVASNSDYQTKFAEKFGAMDRGTLVEYIENNELEKELKKKAISKWNEMEEEVRPKRKKKSL